jgi:hypothetical protein
MMFIKTIFLGMEAAIGTNVISGNVFQGVAQAVATAVPHLSPQEVGPAGVHVDGFGRTDRNRRIDEGWEVPYGAASHLDKLEAT